MGLLGGLLGALFGGGNTGSSTGGRRGKRGSIIDWQAKKKASGSWVPHDEFVKRKRGK